MRTLTAIEFVTVDGVMQGLGSPEEDTDGGFAHGGWGAAYADGVFATSGDPDLTDTSAYLFGRRSFEKMAAFWPSQPDSNPIAAHLNATPKYVASRTLTAAPWGSESAAVLSGDIERAVLDLRQGGVGTVAILGSGVLVRALMRLDLIDTLRLFVHPLLLGTGKRLFGELDAPRPLRLLESDVTPQGSLVLTYSTRA